MADVVRFGVSLDESLLQAFDKMVANRNYPNRSEAVRDLIRNRLVEDRWLCGSTETVGTITLVYDHDKRDLSEKLIELQHRRHDTVISTLHIHLDRHNCLEVLVVKGKPKQIRKLADELIGTKGVKHGKLIASTTGRDLA